MKRLTATIYVLFALVWVIAGVVLLVAWIAGAPWLDHTPDLVIFGALGGLYAASDLYLRRADEAA